MVTLALSLLAISLSAPSGDLRLHVDVFRHAPLDPADLDTAREVASVLLGSAGVALNWREELKQRSHALTSARENR